MTFSVPCFVPCFQGTDGVTRAREREPEGLKIKAFVSL